MPSPSGTSTDEAIGRYAELGIGDPELDHLWGLFTAFALLVMEAVFRRAYRAERAKRGARQPKNQPLPAWAARAWDKFEGLFAAHDFSKVDLVPGFTTLIADPRGRATISEVVRTGALSNMPLLDETMVRGLENLAARQKPAARSELRWFFMGTRVWFVGNERPEPTGTVMALLAAIAGVEPLDEGLDVGRRRWDGRLHRWRADMDAESPQWREQVRTMMK